MSTYYNENDRFAADWLQGLMKGGQIAEGTVDRRSIADIRTSDLAGYTRAHFFAGIGGWDLALRLAGWPADRPVWTGSCPCQPFSSAGRRRGVEDERHLWPVWRPLIAELRPPVVLGEQVASEDGRLWLTGVRADMEAVGYAFGAADLCSASIGAPHMRQRFYWVAYAQDRDWWRGERCAKEGTREDGVGGGRSGERGDSSRVGDTDASGLSSSECEGMERAWRRKKGRAVKQSGRSLDAENRMGHSDSPGQTALPGDDGEVRGLSEEERQSEHGSAISRGPGSLGVWDDSAFIPCGDGKARRLKPGIVPLAHGIPVDVGRCSPRKKRVAIRSARSFRAGAIKGFGNAINPVLAAEFVKAVMEIL